MDDDIELLSSSSSVTSVTCSSSNPKKSHHQSVGSTTTPVSQINRPNTTTGQQRLNSCSFMRRSSSPSFISSLSRSDNENSTNRTSINNDSVSSSNSSVFIEEPTKTNKLLKASDHDVSAISSRHRTSYSDDYESEFNSICNLSKLKLKQEEISFLTLIHECQVWIETISGSKFAFPNDFRKSLENGVLLCELLNVLKKSCVRRINRHSTPIAGIDNLNVFLKTCQDHFQLNQADLFDITDLEDLSRRRGEDLVTSPYCYNPDDSKDSSDLNSTSSEKSHCNPNLNDYLTDEEKRRRLKKVINTINWLSRKAIELGIPIPYHFDTNNPSIHAKPSDIHHRSHNQHHSNHHHKTTLGCSYNSVSSSTSSTSSSSSYCSSFSNSSLNQYSTSSSLSSSSSLSVIVPASNPALLPPQIPHTKVSTPKPGNNNSFCSNSGSANQHHLLAKKRYSTNSALINNNTKNNLDDIDGHHLNAPDDTKAPASNSLNQIKQNYTMSYIYKTQQSNLNGGKLANSLVSRRSASLQIDPSSSSNSNSSSSSTTSEYNTAMKTNNNSALPADTLNRKDSVETIDSISNSSTNSSLLNKNSSASSIGNGQHVKPLSNNLGDSQEDLQLIDSTMSPISSTNSAAVSPRLTISTSSSSNNISNSNTNLNSTNISNTLNHSQQHQQPVSNTTVIPTRYIDRRVSNTPVEQKFNINYSKAGQELARKAAEQLKTVEKSKEVQKKMNSTAGFLNQSGPVNQKGPSLLQAALAYNKKPVESGRPKASGSGGGSASDDWQNSVDDWKNRRRAKKNLPPPRTGEELDLDDNEHRARSERRRINRFESSVHYLSPPGENSKPRPTILEQQETSTITEKLQESPQKSPDSNGTTQYASKSEPVSNSNKKDELLNESLINEDEEESMICTDFKYMFNEKFVEINRPFDHPKRGFGFLLNSGLANKTHNCLKKLQDQSINQILEQNYAQIMVVEHETLADQAGIQKGDLVTHINKVGTANLTNEQLRKVMKERLQQNFVQLNLLQLEKTDEPNSINEITTIEASELKTNEESDSNVTEETKAPLNTNPVETTPPAESDQLNVPKTTNNELLKPVTSSSQLQQQKIDYQHIVAPKPYKKTVSAATLPTNPPTTTTTTTLPNQPVF